MKTPISLLVGLIIGIIIGYILFNVSKEPISDTEQETIDYFIQNRTVDPNQGGPISAQLANDRLNAFKNWKPWLLNRQGYVLSSAYSFGLNPIKQFIAEIDSINAVGDMTHKADSITGMRIHLSLVKRKSPEGKTLKYLDLFLVPVRYSGDNYVAVDEKYGKSALNPISPVYNTSNPCPDVCD